jgi:hypothetical protein
LTILHNELAADHGVIDVEGLTEDDGRDRVVHASVTKLVQIHGEEVGALATFQASNIVSSQHRRTAARSQIQGFPRRHQFLSGSLERE